MKIRYEIYNSAFGGTLLRDEADVADGKGVFATVRAHLKQHHPQFDPATRFLMPVMMLENSNEVTAFKAAYDVIVSGGPDNINHVLAPSQYSATTSLRDMVRDAERAVRGQDKSKQPPDCERLMTLGYEVTFVKRVLATAQPQVQPTQQAQPTPSKTTANEALDALPLQTLQTTRYTLVDANKSLLADVPDELRPYLVEFLNGLLFNKQYPLSSIAGGGGTFGSLTVEAIFHTWLDDHLKAFMGGRKRDDALLLIQSLFAYIAWLDRKQQRQAATSNTTTTK